MSVLLLDLFEYLELDTLVLLFLHLLDLAFGVDFLDLLGSCEVQFGQGHALGSNLILDWQWGHDK